MNASSYVSFDLIIILIFKGYSIFWYIFRYLHIVQQLGNGENLFRSYRREVFPKYFEVLSFVFVSVL